MQIKLKVEFIQAGKYYTAAAVLGGLEHRPSTVQFNFALIMWVKKTLINNYVKNYIEKYPTGKNMNKLTLMLLGFVYWYLLILHIFAQSDSGKYFKQNITTISI